MGEESINTPLPVPYMESVEIHDNKIVIMTSMYIPVQKQDYAFDQGAAYLETFNNLAIVIMALFDRNSNTDACGIAPEFTENLFTDLSTSAWTDYTQHKVSPIRYFYGENTSTMSDPSYESEFTEIVTNFVFNQGEADLSEVYTHMAVYTNLFAEYSLPLNSEGEQHSATFPQIIDYVEDSVASAGGAIPSGMTTGEWADADSTAYDSKLRSVIIDLINQAIENNDYPLVIALFGHLTYPADFFPTPVNESGLIPNMQIVKIHAKTAPVSKHFTDFAANITDVLQKEDGSVILKLSAEHTINGSQFSPAVYGRENQIGIKNMGFVAFTAPWFGDRGRSIENIHHEIRDAVISESSEVVYWENSISATNHILVITNDEVARDPAVAYVDANGRVYQEAMRSLDGTYYDSTSTPLESVISSMTTAVTDSAISADTTLSFQYILSQGTLNPTDILPVINKYRKAFPDKSTTTSEGQFYNAFAEILYNTNTTLKRGTQLSKVLMTNPIVKDWRTNIYGSGGTSTHVGDDYQQAYYELFSLENALWSRYTEVTGHDPEEANISEVTDADFGSAGNPIVMGAVGLNDDSWAYEEYTRTGGQWNYNFIDHGFMFFNYEKALKTTSIASRYLNITAYEKYFGSATLNSLFTMEQCYFKAYWGDPDDPYPITLEAGLGETIEAMDAVYSIGTMVLNMPDLTRTDWSSQWTEFVGTDLVTVGGNADGGMNLDKFDVTVENALPEAAGLVYESAEGMMKSDDGIKIANEFGGADAMTRSTEYSFLALRGFSPVTVQDGVDPFHVSETFFDENPINYRLACIEFQKCDAYDGFEGAHSMSIVADLAQEVDESSRGGAFRTAILVKDKTHQVILDMKYKLENTIFMFEQYRSAANDKCSFNETTGFFNQFFIDTVLSNWPDSADAPYFKSIVELIIFEDIFFGTYGGDSELILEEIKVLTYSVSPNTGTVSGIENAWGRFGFIEEALDSMVTDVGEVLITAGHIYGHAPLYDEDYSAAETTFNVGALDASVKVREGADETLMPDTYEYNCYTPDAGYDNYPLYPADLTITTSQYELPDPPDQDLVGTPDVTDEPLALKLQELQDAYELSNSVLEAMIDAFLETMWDIEGRYGFDYFQWDNIDILNNLSWKIGSTFPDMDDINNYTDPYGNMGASAASSHLYMIENFSTIANIFGDMMSFLNSSTPSELATLVPEAIGNMFSSGAYSATASVSDYMSGNSDSLQNIQSLQMSILSMRGAMAPMQMNNFSWL